MKKLQKSWTLTIHLILSLLKDATLIVKKAVTWFVGRVNSIMQSGLAWIKSWLERRKKEVQSLKGNK